ncbi:MAG TPA: hypothetical protein VIJ04_06850 [Xanthobacteraceae bacterium]
MINNHEKVGSQPRPGDIVRTKAGFDQSLEGHAARRAGLPLREGRLYQVVGCEQGEIDTVLILSEIHIFRIVGIRQVVKVGSSPFPYVSERFERACSRKGRLS